MCSGHDQYRIWNYSLYHGKYTHKQNLMVVAEPNWEQFFIYYTITVLVYQLTHTGAKWHDFQLFLADIVSNKELSVFVMELPVTNK